MQQSIHIYFIMLSLHTLKWIWCHSVFWLYVMSQIWLCDFFFHFTYSPKSSQSFVIRRRCQHLLGHHLEGTPGLDRLQWLWAAVAPWRCAYCLQPLQQQKIRRTNCEWASPREVLSVQCQDRERGFLENLQQTNFWVCEDKYGLFLLSWVSDRMRGP